MKTTMSILLALLALALLAPAALAEHSAEHVRAQQEAGVGQFAPGFDWDNASVAATPMPTPSATSTPTSEATASASSTSEATATATVSASTEEASAAPPEIEELPPTGGPLLSLAALGALLLSGSLALRLAR